MRMTGRQTNKLGGFLRRVDREEGMTGRPGKFELEMKGLKEDTLNSQ